MMARASRKLAISHLAQHAAQRLLGHGDPELLENPLAKIDDPPSHDPMNRRDRSALKDRRQRRAMLVVQPRRLPRALRSITPSGPCALNLSTQSRTICSPRRRSWPPRCEWPRRRSPQAPAIAAPAARPSTVSPPRATRLRQSHPEAQSPPPSRTPSIRNGRITSQLIRESGGLCEVVGARVGRCERRPHISRIERSRGPVGGYGESAWTVLILNAEACVAKAAAGDRRRVRTTGRRRLGGWSGNDDAVGAEASGRRPNDALKLGAGGAMARRRGDSKAIEIGQAFVVMMCRSERRRICAARWAPCGA